MTSASTPTVAPATGRLGVLTVGLGAVASTLIAGVELAKRGQGLPIGSLTQMGTIRLGKRTENRSPLVKDFVPLAALDDIVWGAWDVYPDDAYVAASRAGVLEQGKHIEGISDALRDVRPMQAAFERKYARNLEGEHIKPTTSKRAMLEAIREDINRFREEKQVDRVVMIWCASTEIFIEPGAAHLSIEAFEKAIDAGDETVSPAQLYAYAALLERVPFANGAPNLAVDAPCLRQYATEQNVAISGKDFKTGQTLMKTVLAPMLKARQLGLSGWYSTNILGNRDGEVLDAPENFKTKEESKLGVLEDILEPTKNPDLYGDVFHKVQINYYPPRGDNKEGWDNIDIFGWLNYPMQIKVNFLCRDSILAAPLALDLVLFSDLAQRAGLGGIQEWLSFYYKSPQVAPGLYAEHDLFIQLTKLKNTLRWMMGADPITHLGREYYDEI
ncbi:MAG TPA: inositol-3-phosphate synthase [Ilumatobacteraceae bacterium]|nr:inositol-3-phosphate synthase [Ilumatobacteraceae bacterium]